jgi:hypothetical protein
MSGHSHPSPAGAAPSPSWVVTLGSDGVEKGMVGPFPDAAAAEAWAAGAVEGRAGWSWRCEPVVSPAALPRPERRQQIARRHLRLVR